MGENGDVFEVKFCKGEILNVYTSISYKQKCKLKRFDEKSKWNVNKNVLMKLHYPIL